MTKGEPPEHANTVFMDVNVPMYPIGAPHPHRETVRHTLEMFIARGDRPVTDAAGFQQILHHYFAMHCADAIRAAFNALHDVVDDVCAVELADVEQAKVFMLTVPSSSARVMLRPRRPCNVLACAV